MPSLSLVAHDHLQRLAEGKRARTFGFIPDAIVAAILGAENLLIPAVDPAVTAASVLKMALGIVPAGSAGMRQGSESDLQLLQRIAMQYDADFWVEGDVIYLSRFIKEYEPRLALTWGGSLLDFSPRVSTVGQVAAVTMRFTLREIPFTFSVTVGWDFDRESVSISVFPGGDAPGFSGPGDTTIDRPIRTPLDVAANALVIYRKLREKLNNRLTGSGSAIGDPRIRAGAVIRLEGLGPDFSGDYRVKSATHSLDGGGYKTSFEVFKEILP